MVQEKEIERSIFFLVFALSFFFTIFLKNKENQAKQQKIRDFFSKKRPKERNVKDITKPYNVHRNRKDNLKPYCGVGCQMSEQLPLHVTCQRFQNVYQRPPVQNLPKSQHSGWFVVLVKKCSLIAAHVDLLIHI